MKQTYLRTLAILFYFSITLTSFCQNTVKHDPQNFCQDSVKHNPQNADEKLLWCIYSNSSAFKTSLALHFDNTDIPMCALMPVAMLGYGRKYGKTYDENSGFLLTVSEVWTIGATSVIKDLVMRPRPFRKINNVYQRDLHTKDPFSFPSGHASSSFSIATMFALRYPEYPQAYVPIYLWAIVVSWGRPYLGMHYPSDLLAGAFLGAGSSVLVYSWRKGFLHFKNDIFRENKTDEGSINGGVVSIFAGSLLLSELLNDFVFQNNRISFRVNSNGINLRWGF